MSKSKFHLSKRSLSLAIAITLCSGTVAFAAPDKPDAGTTLNSLNDKKNVAPKAGKIDVPVPKDEKGQPDTHQGAKIQVKNFRIVGQTLYPEKQLLALVQGYQNKELTLDQIQEAAGKITKYLHEQGYIVASAYIPAQDVQKGEIEIAVVMGQYDQIQLKNHSRLSDQAAYRVLSRLKSGEYIKGDLLERTLLLLSDTSGINAKATLAPGKKAGTAALVVELQDSKQLTGQISIDNYGNRFTGQDRANVYLNVSNLSHVGDWISLSGTTTGKHLNDGSVNYWLPVGQDGAKLGLGYSQMHYSLGDTFSALNANGSSKTSSFYGRYPLVRSRDYNLYTQVSYDSRKLEDRIDSTPASVVNKRDHVWTFGLNGDNRDSWGGGGYNSFGVTLTTGKLTTDGTDELNTAGNYTKTNVNFSRYQYLNDRLNLYLNLNSQFANKNLDSSEKLSLGGANGVRAYPQGEASGDQGYLLTGELRWNLPTPAFQAAFFVDHGQVRINKEPIAGTDRNNRNLTGAGIGLIWNKAQEYSIRFDYAWKVTSDPATSDTDKNGRFWLQGIRYF